MSGFRRIATSSAFAISSRGFTRRPANSLSCFSSSTSFIVRVTSTVTNSVTCGAVNAEPTIAAAVALRTPLTGMRVSRTESYDAGAADGAGAAGAAGRSAGAVCCGAWARRRPRGRRRG